MCAATARVAVVAVACDVSEGDVDATQTATAAPPRSSAPPALTTHIRLLASAARSDSCLTSLEGPFVLLLQVGALTREKLAGVSSMQEVIFDTAEIDASARSTQSHFMV